MSSYFIESFKIDKLWGYRNIDLTFRKDVNVLIGPNGSGKTTILNLLHAILSGDLRSVVNFNFQQAKIGLKSFKGNSIRTIKVDIGDESLKLKVGQREYDAPIDIFSRRRPVGSLIRNFYERDNVITNLLSEEIDGESTPIVPLVWLPVSRHLPVTEDEEERYTRKKTLESVDLRLEDLLDGLSRYHSILNAQLSERYREFERQVLSTILYSKEHDQVNLMLKAVTSSSPTEVEKDQLLRAFDDIGLLNEQMRSRINDHFTAVEESIKRTKRFREKGDKIVELDHMLVLPLVSRTKDMVEFARKLEKFRKDIFASLYFY